MLPSLLIVLGLYLVACYGYGMYLVVRLLRGRRLRHTVAGMPPRRLVRATSRYERDELAESAEEQAEAMDSQRLAA
ncbi:MAG: hypothetical protein AAGC44_04350 [Planctomycetota bacterium]